MSLFRFLNSDKILLCPYRGVVLLCQRQLCMTTSSDDVTTNPQFESLPFFIKRTKTNNIPVYLDYKSGRSRTLTIVRKIEGDVHMLEKKLREKIGVPDLLTRVDELTGQIVLHGDHRNTIMQYLKSLGY